MKGRSTTTAAEEGVREAHFQIDAALFEELGERLVSRPEIALAELVKNAYDADAKRCRISISSERIIVADSGHGLTETEFLRNWMVVSTQDKGQQRFSRRFRRSMAGSKGVGRFSARFLGSHLELDTVAVDPETNGKKRLVAKFDWKHISKYKTIQEIVVPYTVGVAEESARLGTTLRITNLREHVRELASDRVKTDILRLIDPSGGLESPHFHQNVRRGKNAKADPGFQVVFREAEDGEESATESVDVAQAILNAYVGRVRIAVDEEGHVDFKVFWRGNQSPIEHRTFALRRMATPLTSTRLAKELGEKDHRGVPKTLEDIQHLPLAAQLNTPVFIDLRFFPKRKGTFTNLPVNGTQAQAWLKENGSFAVVDNKFVMPAYADQDSDWLAIEASKARNERSWQSVLTPALYPMSAADKADPKRNPMLALPRMTQIFGRVHISTQKRLDDIDDDSWLQPNMDRESLRANGAFNLLWHLCRFAAEAIAHFDRKQRLAEQEAEERKAQRAAKTALSAAISDIKSSKDIEPAYRAKILEQLKAAESRILETEAYQNDARISLELMSLMGVMAGFMTHEFEKALANMQRVARGIAALGRAKPEFKDTADRIKKNEKSLANYLEYMRLFIEKAREPVPEAFKARAQLVTATHALDSLAADHGVTIVIDADAKMAGPYVPVAAYHGIVVNLVSNAMKAIVPRVGNGPRKIRVFATNEGNRHILVCADTGIGIPEYLRDRIWDPLFTTTAKSDENPLGSGLGLGLSVVQRVVTKFGGRIELLKDAPPGYTTAFRVSLPLEDN